MTFSIHPQTVPGEVALTVSDLGRMLTFYQQILGLRVIEQTEETAGLGAGSQVFVRLFADPGAQPPPARSTGLYHMAVLFPSRRTLAQALQRLALMGWPIQGASDHGVSEAIYLADPEGNGIELYRDRPRDEWPVAQGQLQMVTEPLDFDGLVAELNGQGSLRDPQNLSPAPEGTRMGHVHLRVSSLPESEEFYTRALGFDLVQRYGRQAGFVSAGGYHHHIGFNTWSSAGASPPPPASTGLRYYSLVLPDREALDALKAHLQGRNIHFNEGDERFFLTDPAGNRILIKQEVPVP